jgi:type II secretory pathway pseudopilin PulG
MTPPKISPSQILRSPRGFSLVEVVLAVGIVTFAIIVIVSLFGSLLSRHKEVADRQEAINATGALNAYLETEVTFPVAFSWAKATSHELAYVLHRADGGGAPSASGTNVVGKWIDATNATASTAMDSAREGKWIKVVLKWNETLNPMAQSALPAQDAGYPEAALVFDATFYLVPNAAFPITSNAVPSAVIPVAVSR